MLRKSFFGMMVFIVGIMLVFTLSGCDNGIGGGGSSNPFLGTWNGFDQNGDLIRFVVTGSTWTLSWPNFPGWGSETGTYTHSGNSGTFFQHGVVIGTATVSGNIMTVTVSGLGDFFVNR